MLVNEVKFEMETPTKKQPKLRLYAETTHCCRLVGMSSASPIVGRMITVDWTVNVYIFALVFHLVMGLVVLSHSKKVLQQR